MSDDAAPDLDKWPAFVAEVANDALAMVATYPRAALSQARVAVEAVCVHVHWRELGNPGKALLDELVRKLAAKKVLSPQRELPMRTVQAWGNYGAHPIDFAKIDREFVQPCMVALQQVVAWYFAEYLKTSTPTFVTEAPLRAPVTGERTAAIVIVSTGQRYPLRRGTTTLIGRDPSAQIQLDESDRKVHREHATIELPLQGAPILREVTGKNPTRVNDVRIDGATTLRHGDHVQVGATILRVELE